MRGFNKGRLTAVCGFISLFAAGCNAPQGQLLYVTNVENQPLTAFEVEGNRETRVCEIPSMGVGGPGFLRAGEIRHTVVLRSPSGTEAHRFELAPETVWTVSNQAHEAFYICVGYGDKVPYGGRDPRRDPRDDVAPGLAGLRRINPIAALGVCGWIGTIGVWAWRRRNRISDAPSWSSRY